MDDSSMRPIDATDRRLIKLLRDEPRGSITALAARAGIARGTAYSRIDRLEREGVIVGYGPEVGPAAAGFGVTGFCTLEIQQGSHASTVDALASIGEVLEIHTVTGPGDVLVRVVARSNDHLHDVLQRITALPTVSRSTTQLALSSMNVRSVADVVGDDQNP